MHENRFAYPKNRNDLTPHSFGAGYKPLVSYYTVYTIAFSIACVSYDCMDCVNQKSNEMSNDVKHFRIISSDCHSDNGYTIKSILH
jgi:hypothetical protein